MKNSDKMTTSLQNSRIQWAFDTYAWIKEDPHDKQYVYCPEHCKFRKHMFGNNIVGRWNKDKVRKDHLDRHETNYHQPSSPTTIIRIKIPPKIPTSSAIPTSLGTPPFTPFTPFTQFTSSSGFRFPTPFKNPTSVASRFPNAVGVSDCVIREKSNMIDNVGKLDNLASVALNEVNNSTKNVDNSVVLNETNNVTLNETNNVILNEANSAALSGANMSDIVERPNKRKNNDFFVAQKEKLSRKLDEDFAEYESLNKQRDEYVSKMKVLRKEFNEVKDQFTIIDTKLNKNPVHISLSK